MVHPRKLTWNPKIGSSENDFAFPRGVFWGSMIVFRRRKPLGRSKQAMFQGIVGCTPGPTYPYGKSHEIPIKLVFMGKLSPRIPRKYHKYHGSRTRTLGKPPILGTRGWLTLTFWGLSPTSAALAYLCASEAAGGSKSWLIYCWWKKSGEKTTWDV